MLKLPYLLFGGLIAITILFGLLRVAQGPQLSTNEHNERPAYGTSSDTVDLRVTGDLLSKKQLVAFIGVQVTHKKYAYELPNAVSNNTWPC